MAAFLAKIMLEANEENWGRFLRAGGETLVDRPLQRRDGLEYDLSFDGLFSPALIGFVRRDALLSSLERNL